MNTAAIITKAELDRIRQETVIKSDAQIRAEKKMLNAQKEQQFMDNTRRKERMKGFDVTRQSNMKRTDGGASKAQPQADGLLSKAYEQMDEDLDDVKHMNHLMLQSKVVTIRDMQLKEN